MKTNNPDTLRAYVHTLTEAEMVRIIEGYDTLSEDGAIGNEPIRQHANAFLEKHGIPRNNIIMWMTLLAAECHRYFSVLYRARM